MCTGLQGKGHPVLSLSECPTGGQTGGHSPSGWRAGVSESLQALGLSGTEWVKLALEDEKGQRGQLGARGTREGRNGEGVASTRSL